MKLLENNPKLITYVDPKAPAAEAFRTLRTNIYFCSPDEKLHTIMLTSPGPGEGKTTITSNLAVALAQGDEDVILVDADLRRGTTHKVFGLNNSIGLTNVLMGKAELDKALQPTSLKGLRVLTSGPIPPNPAELFGSKAMSSLIEELKEKASLVLFDAPPLLVVTDAVLLSTRVDGTVLVIDSGSVPRDVAIKAKNSLSNVKARILGVVLNNMPMTESYYYYYYYSNEKKDEKS